MKKLFCSLCLALALASTGIAADRIDDYDGNSWTSWDMNRKGSFIEGFVSGSSFTAKNTIRTFYLNSRHDYEYNDDRASQTISQAIENFRVNDKIRWNRDIIDAANFEIVRTNRALRNCMVFGLSPVSIKEGLDVLYADKNNLDIMIADAVHLLKKNALGTDPDDLKLILIFLREKKRDIERLVVRDGDGNIVRMIEFP